MNRITCICISLMENNGQYEIAVQKEFAPENGGGKQTFRESSPTLHGALNIAREMVTVSPAERSTVQRVTPEFSDWLKSTGFAGVVHPGEQWDTDVAWPNALSMIAAQQCFNMFYLGNVKMAQSLLIEAQSHL